MEWGGRVLANSNHVNAALQTTLATAAFAAVHSLLASSKAKDAAAARVPHARELYRVAYNAQATLAFGALVWFIARQPKRTIYRVRGAAAVAMRAGQLAGIAFAAAAVRATGFATLSGLDNLAAVVRGSEPKPVPAAQGPEADETGALRARGPFVVVRHPLNLAPLAPFWLTPHLTTRRLAFNLVATAYFVLGSLHEEARLTRQYGDRYMAYQKGPVPFYLPGA